MKLLQISNFWRIHIQSMQILITECIACIHFIHQRLLLDIFNVQSRVLYPICKYFMVFTEWYVNCHLKIIANIKQWWDLNLIYISGLTQFLSPNHCPMGIGHLIVICSEYHNFPQVYASQLMFLANLSTLFPYFLFIYQSLLVGSCIQLYCY